MSSRLEMSAGFHPLCALVISSGMGWYHLSLPQSPLYTWDSHDYTSPDHCNSMPTGLPALILVSLKSILHTPARVAMKLTISIGNHLLHLLLFIVSLAPTPERKRLAHALHYTLKSWYPGSRGVGLTPSSCFCLCCSVLILSKFYLIPELVWNGSQETRI